MKWYVFLSLTLAGLNVSAQFLTATRNWTNSLGVAQIESSDAGNDYGSSVESYIATTLLSPSLRGMPDNQKNGNWQIQTQRTNDNWHPLLSLFAWRTSDGTSNTGQLSTTGGLKYQEITLASSLFHAGKGNFNDIPIIHYRLQGMSVIIPVGTYSTTVTYTLLDN